MVLVGKETKPLVKRSCPNNFILVGLIFLSDNNIRSKLNKNYEINSYTLLEFEIIVQILLLQFSLCLFRL